MTVTAHRARRRRPARTAATRAALAGAALVAVLPTAACGFGAQTFRPYTPAEGVNFDVGNQSIPDSVIHVRNLLIISRSPGEGIVSATMVTAGRDSLTSVTGAPYLVNGDKAAASFVAQVPGGRVLLTNNAQVVLTNQQPFITISNTPGLRAGLDAEVTVTFAKAGSYTTRTPVVDGNVPPYTGVTPSASPSASPSVTAAPSPTP